MGFCRMKIIEVHATISDRQAPSRILKTLSGPGFPHRTLHHHNFGGQSETCFVLLFRVVGGLSSIPAPSGRSSDLGAGIASFVHYFAYTVD